ncbi:Histone promoter control protein 2 [Candida viswanathii]|uniref:Histone promoter control protein 2 n=1 Tax=Candida viswanathii TaxID=5486 RepID=A0A367YD06_9ASCO|nr:Histone promoter control protein 2 [Candida viswanathii]
MPQANSNNISISSLLDSGSSSSPPQQQGSSTSASSGNANRNGTRGGSQRPVPLLEMVSKYKTSFNLTTEDPEIIMINDTPSPSCSRKPSPGVANKPPSLPRSKSKTPSSAQTTTQQQETKPKRETVTAATATPAFVSDQVKKFQTSFQLNPSNTSPSKTSINSIINLDDGGNQPSASQSPSPSVETAAGTNGNKRKRPPPKLFDPKKRRSGSPAETATTQTIAPAPIAAKGSTPGQPVKIQPQSKSGGARPGSKPQAQQQLQKSPAIDKKPAGLPATSLTSAPSTTQKNDPVIPVKVSAPTVIDLLNADDDDDEIVITKEEKATPAATTSSDKSPERAKEKDKEKPQETPIIALDIPLLNPKNPQPGKAEVIVNVLKLAEEKYGWSVMHPNSKNALDIMDEMIDDEEEEVDDENEEDEDADVFEVPNPALQQPQSSSSNATKDQTSGTPQLNLKEKELTEEQLFRQHEVRMIRKVGKYDVQDEFIDDTELQIEEQISSTKEGFFVYWGPLVDEKTITKIKKKR